MRVRGSQVLGCSRGARRSDDRVGIFRECRQYVNLEIGALLPSFGATRKWRENNIVLGPPRLSLRQSVKFAPGGKIFDRRVNLAFSQIGGKHFAGFHFRVLRQLLEAFAFLFRVGIHSLSKSMRHVA